MSPGDQVRLNKDTLPIGLSQLFGSDTWTLVGTVHQVQGDVVVVHWPPPYDQATYMETEHLTLVESASQEVTSEHQAR